MAKQLIHQGMVTNLQAGDRIFLITGLRHAFFVRDSNPMMIREEDGSVQPGKITFDPEEGTVLKHAARFLEEFDCPEHVGLYRVPYSDKTISVFELVRGGRRG